jgi:hypothetical protein
VLFWAFILTIFLILLNEFLQVANWTEALMALDDSHIPRASSSSSRSSGDDIEMADLDDIVVTPNPRLAQGKHMPFGDHDDDSEDDDLENGDEGSRGLLFPRRTRGRERIPTGIWPQVKSIVIEVSNYRHPIILSSVLTPYARAHRRLCSQL